MKNRISIPVPEAAIAGTSSGSALQQVLVPGFQNPAGSKDLWVYYQLQGPALGTAPVVMINHPLTGNAQVTGEKGWWKELVGPKKCIDSELFTVLSMNVPGNGVGQEVDDLIENYQEITLLDTARLFLTVLDRLDISALYALVGGSLGGALVWQMAALRPELCEHIVPIATDMKATAWLLAQCRVQEQILVNSRDPLHDARMHAMTLYRGPASFSEKFGRERDHENNQYKVNTWLSYHGRALEKRFQLKAYLFMNHLLSTLDISQGTGDHLAVAAKIRSTIHVITIGTDLLFPARENRRDHLELLKLKREVYLYELSSPHGHDAFLIETRQMKRILSPIFEQVNQNQ